MSPFNDISVSEILPQREPFLFVDRLVHYDERETVTEFRIAADHLLVADGYLTAPGILENMAQSSAARIGYLCKYVLHVPVRIGYIPCASAISAPSGNSGCTGCRPWGRP